MALDTLLLSFYGVDAELRCDHPAVLDELRRDFEYFAAPAPAGASVRIRWDFLAEGPPPSKQPAGSALWRARDYAVFDSGSRRTVVFDDPALAVYDYRERSGRLWCGDVERLHELAYLAVLSRVGEALDLQGLHRAHALGFSREGHAGLLLLPTGGGKSSLSLELLRSTRMGLLSEDTPLLSSQFELLAFPLRMGFRAADRLSGIDPKWLRSFPRKHFGPKRLVDVGYFRERVCERAPLRWLFVGERSGGARPHIEPTSRGQALASLAKHLVIGYGVAQMSEYMLRPSAAGLLARIALARARIALKLAAKLSCYRFTLGDDPSENIAALERSLDR